MPQLDINTFIYQYLGLVILFIFFYVTLGYIVLPILLRLLTIRIRFLEQAKNMSQLDSNLIETFHYLLIPKINNFSLTIISSQFSFIIFLNNILIKLINISMKTSNSDLLYSNIKMQGINPTVICFMAYLISFITLDEDNLL